MKDEIHAMCREPDFCERCQRFDELVACIGPDGALLAMICEDCAKEYIYSGLDEPDGYEDARGD
jgi:hypothetical protein